MKRVGVSQKIRFLLASWAVKSLGELPPPLASVPLTRREKNSLFPKAFRRSSVFPVLPPPKKMSQNSDRK